MQIFFSLHVVVLTEFEWQVFWPQKKLSVTLKLKPSLIQIIPCWGIESLRPRNLQRPKNKRRQDKKKCQALIIFVGNTS